MAEMPPADSPAAADPDPDLHPDNSEEAEGSDALSGIFGSSSDGSEKSPEPADILPDDAEEALVRVLEPEVPGSVEDMRVESDEEGEERPTTPIGGPMYVEAPMENRPDKSTLRLVKMTNFVAVEKSPYNPSTYMQVDADSGGFGNQAVMRWRVNEEGERESNSRFVRWSNGSLSLMIGDECFDVDELALDNCYLYLRHPSVMMQGMGAIPSKFIFRPAEVRKRRVHPGNHSKGPTRQSAKVQKITTLTDPAREKEERTRREEERIRDRESLVKRQRKEQEKYYVPQPAPLAGVNMGDEDRAVVEQKHRTQIKKEPRRASSRREDARPNKKQRSRENISTDEPPGDDEFMEEPKWNDEDATEASGEDLRGQGQEQEPQPGVPSDEDKQVSGDGEDSDDGNIGVPNRKPTRGHALLLSDSGDDDDDM